MTGTANAQEGDGSSAGRRKLLKTFMSEFVEITPGKGRYPASFRMGAESGQADEQPVHTVTFKHSFAMARYEVPQNLYAAVLGHNPSKWTGPRNSVEMFDYTEARRFCSEITKQLRTEKLLKDHEVIRLPTEAEWEYCCRAGSSTAYSFGENARADGDIEKKASFLDIYCWHTGNASGNDPPVGALMPNAWGLYDMHGYLWEFVLDDWQASYEGAPEDGTARRTKASGQGTMRVLRGGSWRELFPRCSSTARFAVAADFKRDDAGLRCVKARVTD